MRIRRQEGSLLGLRESCVPSIAKRSGALDPEHIAR